MRHGYFALLTVSGLIASFACRVDAQIRTSQDSFRVWSQSRAVIEQLPTVNQQAVVDLVFDQLAATRIVGGRKISQADYQSQFPWVVGLGVKRSNGQVSQFCGGSLISDRWVLTAAHCDAFPSPASFVSVSHGNVSFSLATRVPIKRFVRHPSYASANSGHDIALIELQEPVTGLRSVLLADTLPQNGTTSEIIGWGAMQAGGDASNVLQHGQVDVVDISNCTEAYRLAPFEVSNWPTMVCAAKTGIDSCQGDSGGPITIGVGANARQFGVVSFGEGCADIRFPGVYSNVPALREWVRTISGV